MAGTLNTVLAANQTRDREIQEAEDDEALEKEKMQESLFKYPSWIVIASKRNSGKSYFMERLLLVDWAKFDEIYLMSQTVSYEEKDYPTIKKLARLKVKPMYIGPFSLGMVRALQKRQEKDKSHHVLLLLDDIIPVMKGPALDYISNLSTMSRHLNMTVMMLIQKANKTYDPQLRQNTDYLLFSKLNTKMLEYVNEVLMMQKDKLMELVHGLDDYEFILYDNTTNHPIIKRVHFE